MLGAGGYLFGGKTKSKKPDATRFDTLIDTSTSVEGKFHFSGVLKINGTVHGTIKAVAHPEPTGVIIEGHVAALGETVIEADHVTINGHVAGHVISKQTLVIGPRATIIGDLTYHGTLKIEEGAEINGMIKHVEEPEIVENK